MTFKEIKNKITDTQIILIIKALGGDCDENLSTNDYLIFSSLLYHGLNANNHSYKMYYYRETKTFHDYKLGESFDIYDLICRLKNINMPQAKDFICSLCGIKGYNTNKKNTYLWMDDFVSFEERQVEENKIYDKGILNIFKPLYHISWIKDNITVKTMQKFGICYTYKKIIIPLFDVDNNLIGIRYRTLEDNADFKYKQYTDALGKMYTFKTRNNFYGLRENYNNIKKYKECILFESEKSVLQCDDYLKDNIALGLFGKELSQEKINTLLTMGVQTVNIAIDFDYKDEKTLDKYFRNVYNVYKKVKPYFNVYLLYNEKLPHGYKDSPSDGGKDLFLKYLESRCLINEEKEKQFFGRFSNR